MRYNRNVLCETVWKDISLSYYQSSRKIWLWFNICVYCKWVCIFECFLTASHLDFNEQIWGGKFQMIFTDTFGSQTNIRLRRIFYCAIESTRFCNNLQDSTIGVKIWINTHIHPYNTWDLQFLVPEMTWKFFPLKNDLCNKWNGPNY